jgi:hypothetical protein
MTPVTDPAEEYFKDGLWGWNATEEEWVKIQTSDGALLIQLAMTTYTRQILWYLPAAALATGSDKSATIVYRGPDLTLTRWDFRAKTAPTGAALIADVNIAGTSLWATTQANRPTIAAAATSGTGTAFDTTTLTDGDVLTIDVDQIGSTIPGGQATVILEGTAETQIP